MANGEPLMSSIFRSGSTRRHSSTSFGFDREMARPAGPVCQTPRNQTHWNPLAAMSSRNRSSRSSSVAGRPSATPRSCSTTRVLI